MIRTIIGAMFKVFPFVLVLSLYLDTFNLPCWLELIIFLGMILFNAVIMSIGEYIESN
jgi:hypothetical protein